MDGGIITPLGWCIMSHYVRIIRIYIRSIYIYQNDLKKCLGLSSLSISKQGFEEGWGGGVGGWEGKRIMSHYVRIICIYIRSIYIYQND